MAVGGRARTLVVATTTVLAVIIARKVSSVRVLLWLMPLGLTISLAADDRATLPMLVAVLTVAQIVFPISSAAAESMRAWPYGFVLLRNLALLAWAGRTNVLPR